MTFSSGNLKPATFSGKLAVSSAWRLVRFLPLFMTSKSTQLYFCVSFSDFESLDEDTQVVATARGKFTSQGGVLSSPESGVSIVIPEGAIPDGVEQEIYFKVCKDNNFMPPLDSDRGTVVKPRLK